MPGCWSLCCWDLGAILRTITRKSSRISRHPKPRPNRARSPPLAKNLQSYSPAELHGQGGRSRLWACGTTSPTGCDRHGGPPQTVCFSLTGPHFLCLSCFPPSSSSDFQPRLGLGDYNLSFAVPGIVAHLRVNVPGAMSLDRARETIRPRPHGDAGLGPGEQVGTARKAVTASREKKVEAPR